VVRSAFTFVVRYDDGYRVWFHVVGKREKKRRHCIQCFLAGNYECTVYPVLTFRVPAFYAFGSGESPSGICVNTISIQNTIRRPLNAYAGRTTVFSLYRPNWTAVENTCGYLYGVNQWFLTWAVPLGLKGAVVVVSNAEQWKK